MSDFKNDPGFGQLFKNKFKNAENQPTHKGSFTDPSGKEWEISAWIKEGRNGRFFSLRIQEPYVKPADDGRPQSKPIGDFDDDIPF